VAVELAQALRAPLDVIVVRKLGVPGQPELGMGAVGEGGARIINPDVVRVARVSAEELAAVQGREQVVLTRRAELLRGDQPAVTLAGRTALIVDDGVATGSTARAACQVARARGATKVVLAVPVADAEAIDALRADADEVISVLKPTWLSSIGEWYVDFSATTDQEVRDLLARAAALRPDAHSVRAVRDQEVTVRAGTLNLPGNLTLPEDTRAIVVFVHGSGSSRHSPRNQFVATVLNRAGLGTLLFDLLTPEEEADRANVFDIELLAGRLAEVTAWLREQPWAQHTHVGWFGASTGAGAALWAAAEPDAVVSAIVSRGGRPDLAGPRLAEVRAPTLLVVGGLDTAVLDLDRAAQAKLRCPTELVIVPGATHLFEEPGTLATAAGVARDWFTRHLRPAAHAHRATG
jgi:putative phosphoribosyl transferase